MSAVAPIPPFARVVMPYCTVCHRRVLATDAWGTWGEYLGGVPAFVHLACESANGDPIYCPCGVLLRAKRQIIVQALACPVCGRPATNAVAYPAAVEQLEV